MKNISIKLLTFVATSVFTSTQASTIDNNDVLKEMNTRVQISISNDFINFMSDALYIKSPLSLPITISQLQNPIYKGDLRCSPYPECKYQVSDMNNT